MKVSIAAIVIVGAIAVSSVTRAQTSAADTVHAPGYKPLGALVGRWTVNGREKEFVEVCRWYDGDFHIICETEVRRANGAISHGMSILGYLPDQNTYSYYGIGSNGRNETMSGTFADGILEFASETIGNGATVTSRVRIGPFSEREVPFIAESSRDGVSWETDTTFTYVRLE